MSTRQQPTSTRQQCSAGGSTPTARARTAVPTRTAMPRAAGKQALVPDRTPRPTDRAANKCRGGCGGRLHDVREVEDYDRVILPSTRNICATCLAVKAATIAAHASKR